MAQTVVKLCYLAICVFLFFACSSNKSGRGVDTGYYQNLTTKIITGADVLNTLEIDSGKYTLLMYEHFSNRRYTTHAFHGKNIYFKVDSLAVFGIREDFKIPSDALDVRAYFSNYRCHVCKIDSIYGHIKTLQLSKDSITLAVDLKSAGLNELLKDTIGFSLDRHFFKTFFVDHHGEYENLRIALKEPLKVKKLELFSHMLAYGLDSLPESFGEMTNLEELNLSLFDLKKLPKSFSKLTNLRVLDLSYNEFESFPIEIYQLKNLEVLNLKLSGLDSIPPGIGSLTKLRTLTLDDNKFRDFPLAVTELNNLEYLSITSANISSIPVEIANLEKLKLLDLSSFWSYKDKNQISDISNLTSLTNLESLNLDWNKIERLPDNLCALRHLKKLSLLSTPIRKIPENLQSCKIDTLLIDSYQEEVKTEKAKGRKK